MDAIVGRKLTRRSLIVVGLSLAAAGCASPTPGSPTAAPGGAASSQPATAAPAAATTSTLRLGAAISLSGNFAREGTELKAGYDLWKDTVNRKGGITVGDRKYNIEIVYYDDKSDAQTAAKLTEKLITEDQVSILFGPYSSGITDATANISERYRVITVASSAYGDALYDKGRKYLFCPASRATTDMHNCMQLAKQLDPNLRTMAIVTPDNVAALAWAEGARAKGEQLGIETLAFEKYPLPANDLSSAILSVRSRNPDIVVNTGFIADSILFIRQMKDQRLSPKLFATASPAVAQELIDALGPDAEGMMSGAQFVPTAKYQDPVFGSLEEYVALVREAGLGAPNDRHVSASAAGVMLQLALQQAGVIDNADRIREGFLALDIKETIFGPIKLEPGGINQARTAAVLQIQNKEFVSVYPPEVQAKSPTYPFAPWDQR